MIMYCKDCKKRIDTDGLKEYWGGFFCPKCQQPLEETPEALAAQEAAKEAAEKLAEEKRQESWVALSEEERHQMYVLRWRWLGGGDTRKGAAYMRQNPTASDSDANAEGWIKSEMARVGNNVPDWYTGE